MVDSNRFVNQILAAARAGIPLALGDTVLTEAALEKDRSEPVGESADPPTQLYQAIATCEALGSSIPVLDAARIRPQIRQNLQAAFGRTKIYVLVILSILVLGLFSLLFVLLPMLDEVRNDLTRHETFLNSSPFRIYNYFIVGLGVAAMFLWVMVIRVNPIWVADWSSGFRYRHCEISAAACQLAARLCDSGCNHQESAQSVKRLLLVGSDEVQFFNNLIRDVRQGEDFNAKARYCALNAVQQLEFVNTSLRKRVLYTVTGFAVLAYTCFVFWPLVRILSEVG